MAAIMLKCPYCGGELVFDPTSQRYQCPYCGSDFLQEEMDRIEKEQREKQAGEKSDGYTDETGFGQDASGAEATQENMDETDAGETGHGQDYGGSEKDDAEGAVMYSCPSCGAQIVTAATTAATFCYYCHNPVIFSGSISGEYLPDRIIPFALDKKAAVEKFLAYVKRKKFVPRAFFQKSQIEKLTGVYYPFWVYDCEVRGSIQGEASNVRIWQTGDTEYTETSIYHVARGGQITLKDMSRSALKQCDRDLVENVQPFRLEEGKKFSMGYLSGFQAERRDIEQAEYTQKFQEKAKNCAKTLLQDTVSGYGSVTIHNDTFRVENEEWSYTLLPVWVLTYAGKNGRRYYYTMNGQTGAICGKLPVDYKKLGIVSGIAGLLATLLVLVGGFLL